jgi:hypothetical protein
MTGYEMNNGSGMYRPSGDYMQNNLHNGQMTPNEKEIFRHVKDRSLDRIMSCSACGMCG